MHKCMYRLPVQTHTHTPTHTIDLDVLLNDTLEKFQHKETGNLFSCVDTPSAGHRWLSALCSFFFDFFNFFYFYLFIFLLCVLPRTVPEFSVLGLQDMEGLGVGAT